jgi:hypothetical protein
MGHKTAEGYEAPHETLDVLDIYDLTHFGNDRDLVRICFDAALGDDVPQKFISGDIKGAFFGFSLMLKRLRLVKVSSRSGRRPSPCRVFMMMSSM